MAKAPPKKRESDGPEVRWQANHTVNAGGQSLSHANFWSDANNKWATFAATMRYDKNANNTTYKVYLNGRLMDTEVKGNNAHII